MGIAYLGEIPLTVKIQVHSDEGNPIVVAQPDSPEAEAFRNVTQNLAAQISIRNLAGELKQDIKVSF